MGGRSFSYDQRNSNHRNGITTQNEDDGSTFKVNLSYEPNDSTLFYAQWAEGFRLGGYQPLPPAVNDADNDGLYEFTDGSERAVSENIASDTVENSELGFKSRMLNNRLQVSAAAFVINWQGIPTTLTTVATGRAVVFNNGRAQSKGLEFEILAEPVESVVLSLSGSYVEATLSEDSSLGQKGDDVPGSADVNYRLGVEKHFGVGSSEGFVRADYSYVGEYYNNFSGSGPDAGGYDLLDLSAGVDFGNVKTRFFVHNLFDAEDLTWVESVWAGESRAYRLRPRTVGVSVGYDF